MKQSWKIYRRGNSWWVAIRANGRTVRQTTGKNISDEAGARVEAARIAAPLFLDSSAAVIEFSAARAMELRRQASAIRAEHSSTPIASAWRRWPLTTAMQGQSARDVAPRTQQLSEGCWRAFADWCAGSGIEDMEEVTAEIAGDYLGELRKRTSNRTHNVHLLHLRGMYRRAGLPAGNPFSEARKYKEECHHREPLTVEQAKGMLAAAPAAGEMRALLYLMLYTGLRLGDAATLRIDRVNLEAGVITRLATAKTGSVVEFPLHSALLDVLRGWNGSDGTYLFPQAAAMYQRRNGEQALSRAIGVAIKRGGAKDDSERPEHGRRPSLYGAHCLRTTFATLCAEAGVPIQLVQDWLGHSSQEVTRIYARVASMAAKRRMVGALPAM